MRQRSVIHTDLAPKAIGSYSQALGVGQTVYLSGQIALDPVTMQMDNASVESEVDRVFGNLRAVSEAAGGSLADAVKLTVYLTDLANFPLVNEAMGRYFVAPFPARATIGVKELPRGARVEIDAILELP